MSDLINKHPHRWRRLTSAGHSFNICDVTFFSEKTKKKQVPLRTHAKG